MPLGKNIITGCVSDLASAWMKGIVEFVNIEGVGRSFSWPLRGERMG